MSIYKLHNSHTGTDAQVDGVASLDVQFDGFITGFWGSLAHDSDADDDRAEFEVSFLSSNTFGANDSRGSLFLMKDQKSLLTSGVFSNEIHGGVGGIRISVTAGERIHMHARADTGTVMRATCYIYVDDTSDPRLRRRR